MLKENVGDHDGDMSETKLTERQQKILKLIKESPTITGKQMSETLSVSQRTIERDLSALRKHGVLKRVGKDNDGVWIIKKKRIYGEQNWFNKENMVVNYFLASNKTDGFDTTAADVNGDGEVTMADANQVVNMFLSGEK